MTDFKRKKWKKIYSLVLLMNVLYIAFFYFLMVFYA